MAFWKFVGLTATPFPSFGITAQPGYVYDLGNYAPSLDTLAGTLWATDPGPATDFKIYEASDLANKHRPTPDGYVAFLGDSLTGAAPWGDSMPRYATLLSNGRLQYSTNAGVPGNTSSQMLARLTDVTNSKATTVVVLAGTNDVAQTVPLATTMGNIDAIVKGIRTAGKVPVLGTIPPKLAQRTAVATLNLAIRLYCLDNQVPLIDFYAKLIDPTTGDYLTAYQNDGTHPNAAGYAVMGQAVVDALCSGGSTSHLSLIASCDNADGINKLANPLAVNISTDIPTSWGKLNNGAGSDVTYSVVTGDTSILGNWAQIVTASATGYRALKNGTGSGYSAGDTLLVQGRVSSSGLSGGATLGVQVQFYGATTSQLIQTLGAPVSAGVFSRVLTVPTGTTYVELQILGSASNAGSGTFKVAQTGLYNLTTLGITALGLGAA